MPTGLTRRYLFPFGQDNPATPLFDPVEQAKISLSPESLKQVPPSVNARVGAEGLPQNMRETHVRTGSSGKTRTGTTTTDRRATQRVQFTASADVFELSSGARFSARTTDLGPGGCFVDTLIPFPVGSTVKIVLRRQKATFETGGSVVYSQSGLGMGIAFSELTAEQRAELASWLKETVAEKGTSYGAAATPAKTAHVDSSDHAILLRLINRLVHKGVLTEEEGLALLHDPML